ncbi:MAG: hypothetical protein QNK24_08195 [Desulfuromusa sp.]|nr:hypothetical protein [Desulfuromusa sp.]
MGLVLDELNEEEQTIEVDGMNILIAEHVLPYTKGHKIDYINNPHSQGFAILPINGGC